jgi:hypothetical protein
MDEYGLAGDQAGMRRREKTPLNNRACDLAIQQ